MPYNGTMTYAHQETALMAVYADGAATGFIRQSGTSPNFTYYSQPVRGGSETSFASRKLAVEDLLKKWWDQGGTLTYTPDNTPTYAAAVDNPEVMDVSLGGCHIGYAQWDSGSSKWFTACIDHISPNTQFNTLGLAVDALVKVWYEDQAP